MHLGLVVSDGPDPEGRNRIQVWIPHLSNTLFKSINNKLTDPKFNGGKDLSIKSPSDLDAIDPNIMKTLRTTLPWAEYGAPLFGGSSGNYNSGTGITSTTNTNPFPNNDYIAPPSISSDNNNLTYDGNKRNNTINNKLSNRSTKTTAYSFGTVVGGKDTTSNKEKYGPGVQSTNTGYGNQGKQNLGAGVVAVGSETGFNLGDVIVNQFGQYAIVGDSAGVPNAVDIASVSTYTENGAIINGNKIIPENTEWFLVDSLGPNGVPSTNTGIQQLLANNYGANSITGDGYGSLSFADYVNASNNGIIDTNLGNTSNGQQIAENNEQNKLETSGPKAVRYLNRSGASAKEDNIATAGSAVGTFTTPNAGSKVWVFFIGGDIQRPVYFAQAVNKGDVKAFTG